MALSSEGDEQEWTKPSYPISLTEEEVKSLQQQARAHKTGQGMAVRARFRLSAHAHPEWSNQQIAESAGTRDRTVRKWRGWWIASCEYSRVGTSHC